ncbi:hypothetical protein GJ744_003097 [Endocarpon pusillum]|uniref:NACHT domain-containing protein n=1 Tax=Endocarpon pusillum TaxID=364733 RepID=A0A8H7AQU0_9EURO|nr:hypothetical protein GJ744_003097 [Endocarpon pusillum]
MKDASARDRLAAEKDVLCFEMEAAGLMNHFPCLVIRGICDYSDSHKNKEWQGYAAMAAAAYAKDLLYQITPNKIEAEKPIAQSLDEVQRNVKEVQTRVEEVLQKQRSQEDDDILRWLTPIQYYSQQHDFISQRQPGTGRWLLGSEKFKTWQNAAKHTLYCHGIPGAGKTFLTSIVIDDLLLKQLAQGNLSLPAAVRNLYHAHEVRKTRPLREDLLRVLHSVIALSSKTFILLDAVDELPDDCRPKLPAEIFKIQAKANLNIFVTSRPTLDVQKEFQECILHESLEVRARDEDVASYLDSRIPALRVSDPESLRKQIKEAISKAAEGMFLLAQLYFGFLQDKTTVTEIKNALTEFRRNAEGISSEASKLEALTDAYKHTMERINGQLPGLRKLANKVLCWITCAERPLTSSELQHGLAVIIGRSEFDDENLPNVDTIIAVCQGLVTIDKESQIIRLVHYTMQEYFDKRRHLLHDSQMHDPETYVAESCITYLSFDTFQSGPCPSFELFMKRLRRSPLFDYAARHWGNHIIKASPEIQRRVPNFLENEDNVNSSIQVATFPGEFRDDLDLQTYGTGVHPPTYFGLLKITTALLEKGLPPDHRDNLGRTPLSWASQKSYDAVARLLIEKGAAVDSIDTGGRTPLSWASENGHEAVVQLLIEKGATVDSIDTGGRTPLIWASRNGHEAVVQLLIEKGATVDSIDTEYGQTPLSWASENGYEAVVQLLIEKGAALDLIDTTYGQTPLSWASENGYKAVVQLLIEKGATVDLIDTAGQTPLSWASGNGHEAVVQLLIEKGAAVDSIDTEYDQTPLS